MAMMMAAANATMSPAAAALRDGGLVLSFNGSGFLIFFYVGVLAALERAGVIVQGVTPIGGVSGGAIAAAAFHSGMSPEQRLAATTALNARCRPSNGCPGRLGPALREELDRFFPADSYLRAAPPATTIFVSRVKGNATAVAAARPGALLLPAVPATIRYDNQSIFLDGVAASSYIPKWSGPARFVVYDGEAVYDGGPAAGGRSCPPKPPGLPAGAAYHCVRVECSVGPNAAPARQLAAAPRDSRPAADDAKGRRRRLLLEAATAVATNRAAPAAAPYNAGGTRTAEDAEMDWAASIGGVAATGADAPDIYIGMPSAPRVELSRDQIRAYTLLTTPAKYVPYLVAVGERAAEAWLAGQPGMAEAAAAARARRSKAKN
jgi:hypothetical protein